MLKWFKSALITALLLCGFATLHAQEHQSANIAVGGRGGVTFSKLNFNPTVPQSMKMGAMMGGIFRYIEEKHFGLQVELNVEQRGWKEKFEGYDFQFQRQLTYLQLPMLTHIYFGNWPYRVFFNAGPEVGYMIASKTTSNFDYSHLSNIENFPNKRNTDQFNLPVKNRFDYGISLGAGVEWQMNHKHSLQAEARFYYGLNDVFSNHKADTFSGSNSMSVTVSLGYLFRLK